MTAPRTVPPDESVEEQTASSGSPALPEGKRRRSADRKLAVEQARLRRERLKAARSLGILIAVVLVVGVGAFLIYLQNSSRPQPQPAPEPGELVEMVASNPHVAPGMERPEYNTDPPTSGPHVGDLPEWKVYSTPITKELQVHGLEDGAVIINYRPDLDEETVERLSRVARLYQVLPDPKKRVILAPYPDLSHPIVLTAWRRIARLDAFDDELLTNFIEAYVGKDHHQESAEGPQIQ